MIKCIIIDDEPKARILLEAIIQQYYPQLSIEAICEDLPTGVKAIKKYKPHLVFLDIEMPQYSGLEIVEFFDEDEIDFDIVFTTAYNEYAIRAFKLSAIDYLLKPIDHHQLQETVERYLKKQQNAQSAMLLQGLKMNMQTESDWQNKRIVVSTGQVMHFFKPDEIIMIKGEGAYSELYLNDGTKLMTSKVLKHYEEVLMGIPIFFRCHKSYIINTTYIVQYVRSDGGHLMLQQKNIAYVSSNKIDELMRLMVE
jgi:two-component system, LytTR family, response regulator